MFGPNTPQMIEMSARLRRIEDQQWAANERLARSLRGRRPGWVARLVSLVRGRTRITPVEPAAAVTLSLTPVENASEGTLCDASGSELRAA